MRLFQNAKDIEIRLKTVFFSKQIPILVSKKTIKKNSKNDFFEMLPRCGETVLNTKFGAVILKTAACRFWTPPPPY